MFSLVAQALPVPGLFISEHKSMTEATETPLIDLLRSVPRVAHLRYDYPDSHASGHWAIGSLCHRAANALSALSTPALPEPAPRETPLLFSRRKAIAERLGVKMDAGFCAIVREVEEAHDIWWSGPHQFAPEPAVKAGWIAVSERLPELEVPVFGWTAGGSLSVFMRDAGGGEGWLWARQQWASDIADPNGIEADDDYDVRWWRPLFAAPEIAETGAAEDDPASQHLSYLRQRAASFIASLESGNVKEALGPHLKLGTHIETLVGALCDTIDNMTGAEYVPPASEMDHRDRPNEGANAINPDALNSPAVGSPQPAQEREEFLSDAIRLADDLQMSRVNYVVEQKAARVIRELCDLLAPSQEAAAGGAARDVLAERQRQISVEGWTPEHDDEHDSAEMAQAAACYALNAAEQRFTWPFDTLWPWSKDWWKPKTPRRDLVRAGALILAEIERLDRAALHQQADPTADQGSRG
jgi:hypothetical protein